MTKEENQTEIFTNMKKEISNKFNSTTLTHSENTKETTVKNLVEIKKALEKNNYGAGRLIKKARVKKSP